jgi:hypothetical protein
MGGQGTPGAMENTGVQKDRFLLALFFLKEKCAIFIG